jgi:hypothetical protein
MGRGKIGHKKVGGREVKLGIGEDKENGRKTVFSMIRNQSIWVNFGENGKWEIKGKSNDVN